MLVKPPDFKEGGRSEASGQKLSTVHAKSVSDATATFYARRNETAEPSVHGARGRGRRRRAALGRLAERRELNYFNHRTGAGGRGGVGADRARETCVRFASDRAPPDAGCTSGKGKPTFGRAGATSRAGPRTVPVPLRRACRAPGRRRGIRTGRGNGTRGRLQTGRHTGEQGSVHRRAAPGLRRGRPQRRPAHRVPPCGAGRRGSEACVPRGRLQMTTGTFHLPCPVFLRAGVLGTGGRRKGTSS